MVVNCRVYLRNNGQSKEEAFQGMLKAFRTKLADCGCITEYKRKQSYESPGQKRRRKLKENKEQRNKDKSERI